MYLPGTEISLVSLKFKGKDLLARVDEPVLGVTMLSAMDAKAAQPERRMRVLVMSGSLSCFEVMQYTTMQLRMACGKEQSDWVFIEGTHVHPTSIALFH